MALSVKIFPMFSDNFGFLVIDDKSRFAALVDPGEPEPCLDAVSTAGVELKAEDGKKVKAVFKADGDRVGDINDILYFELC